MSAKMKQCPVCPPIPFEEFSCPPENHFGQVVKSIKVTLDDTSPEDDTEIVIKMSEKLNKHVHEILSSGKFPTIHVTVKDGRYTAFKTESNDKGAFVMISHHLDKS